MAAPGSPLRERRGAPPPPPPPPFAPPLPLGDAAPGAARHAVGVALQPGAEAEGRAQPVALADTPSLSQEETDRLLASIPVTSSLLAWSVARLYMASPQGGDWRYTRLWGIAGLVVDRNLHGVHFIKLFEYKTLRVLWQEELYVGMRYEELRPFFHSFETSKAIIGLSITQNRSQGEFEARRFFLKVRASIPNKSALAEVLGCKPGQEGGSTAPYKKRGGSVVERLKRMFVSREGGGDPTAALPDEIPADWIALYKQHVAELAAAAAVSAPPSAAGAPGVARPAAFHAGAPLALPDPAVAPSPEPPND